MLNSEVVGLEFEGFRYKNTGFIYKYYQFAQTPIPTQPSFYHQCHIFHFLLLRGNLIGGLIGSYTVYLGALAVVLTGLYPKFLSQLTSVFHPEISTQKEKRNSNHCEPYCRMKFYIWTLLVPQS